MHDVLSLLHVGKCLPLVRQPEEGLWGPERIEISTDIVQRV